MFKREHKGALLAKNPIIVTQSWKERVDALLDFLCNGESQVIGKVLHFAIKAEWQARCSEHAHMFFWCQNVIPRLQVEESNSGDTILSDNTELLINAESYVTAWMPVTVKDRFTPEEKRIAIQTAPISDLSSLFLCTSYAEQVNNLVRATQDHKCNRYCTQDYSKPCKSKFPFPQQSGSSIKQITDKHSTPQFRIQLRRNNNRINNYNLPILNLWQANMDMTCVINKAFGALYMAFYTSKVDKKVDVRHVLKELQKMPEDTSIRSKVRKAILSVDSAKCIGVCEAASNILGHPHWRVSSQVKRI